MKRYKIHTGEDSKGLLKVSFVAEPAIQSKLMYFTEEKKRFVFADDEKRIVYAPALIPDLDIFRKNVNGEPANVFFDKETILKLHLDGCRNGYDSKINLNHSETEDITGVYCFENWIVGEDNRAEKLGFEVPEGTLMKGYKVDNEELWQDIKAGKVTGLSIEAALMPIEEEPINKFNMNKKTIIDKIIALFASEDPMVLACEKCVETLTAVISENISPEITAACEACKKSCEAMISEQTPENTASCIDSCKKCVEVLSSTKDNEKINSCVSSCKNCISVMGGEKEVEMEEDPATAEDDKDAKITALETEIADLKAKLAEYETTKMAKETAETEIATLKLANEDKDKEIVRLTADIIEAKKVQTPAHVAKLYSEMTNKEKALYNRGKL